MVFEASRAKAVDKLNNFIEQNLTDYSKLRNFDFGPNNRSNTSNLSPYITHGAINELEVINKSLNKFSFSIDANKLLVPTNPYYHPSNGDIVSGRNPDVGVASGIFGSFTDAPCNVFEDNGSYYVESGSVFKEELNEINLSFGAEFLYSELFALRAGYFHEHPTKGNRRFISFGAGIKYKVLELDLSYILALTQASPLANTITFSIKLNMGSSGSKKEE